MGRIGITREAVRRAISEGCSLDWVEEHLIEPAVLTRIEKGAIYLEAFAALPSEGQQNVVRETFAMFGRQSAALN